MLRRYDGEELPLALMGAPAAVRCAYCGRLTKLSRATMGPPAVAGYYCEAHAAAIDEVRSEAARRRRDPGPLVAPWSAD